MVVAAVSKVRWEKDEDNFIGNRKWAGTEPENGYGLCITGLLSNTGVTP